MRDDGEEGLDMDALVFTDKVPDVVPPPLEPGEEITVPRVYRLPVELDAWLGNEANARGVARADVVRSLIEDRRHD